LDIYLASTITQTPSSGQPSHWHLINDDNKVRSKVMVQDKETLNEYIYPKAFAKSKINITDTSVL
jgi:hypothetical protein